MPDLRNFLRESEKIGDVFKVSREVSVKFEASALIKRLEAEAIVYLEKIRESDFPVVAGVCGRRERVLRALGAGEAEFYSRLLGALQSPVKAERGEDGPVKEVKEAPDLRRLPILTHYEGDGGPYITSALVSARSLDGRVENVSIHRLQVLDNRRLAIRLVPRHLYQLHQSAKEAHRALDVVISIGVHPALSLAASSPAPFGVSEYDVANALLGGGLKLVRGESVEAYAPAEAEIVLEGRLLPGEEVEEGPFVDLTETYDAVRRQPVVEVVKVFRREKPLYQALQPGGCEHRLLMGMAREAKIWEAVRNVVPVVKAVNLTVGGCGWLHAVIAAEKQTDGDAKNIILAAFAAHPSLKHVTVVDPDIDVHNPREVEWALATRFQADKDLVVIPRARGSTLDPSGDQKEGLTAKMGFDATVPRTLPKEKFSKAKIPGEEETCRRFLGEAGR
ncbi:UbiD family decarboxylase [Candidatus Hecatella orcuttiae]|jgi:UbiD family decarboxylase|uniref:UbiD family decarboxylase n=1 Tax=Candidatus Hecatella orcuttiae TaxID=1935119 RepID=UPI002867FCE2|nr:UbiD family decarboxylase [Candidatus Hecatella orcuttiae]